MGRIEVSETTEMFKSEPNLGIVLYIISVLYRLTVLVKILFVIEVRLNHNSKYLRVKET